MEKIENNNYDTLIRKLLNNGKEYFSSIKNNIFPCKISKSNEIYKKTTNILGDFSPEELVLIIKQNNKIYENSIIHKNSKILAVYIENEKNKDLYNFVNDAAIDIISKKLIRKAKLYLRLLSSSNPSESFLSIQNTLVDLYLYNPEITTKIMKNIEDIKQNAKNDFSIEINEKIAKCCNLINSIYDSVLNFHTQLYK